MSQGNAWKTANSASHLAEVVRGWVGAPPNVVVEELPDDLARLLLRVEESEHAHRDQWGCWEHGFSENFRRGQLWAPEVDDWVAAERRRLAKDTTLEPVWPEGASFALCLTHDVDMVARRWTASQHVRSLSVAVRGSTGDASGEAARRRAWAAARALARVPYFGISRAPDAADTLERCVELERSRGVSASYLFTVYPAMRKTIYDAVYAGSDRCRFRGKTRRVREIARELHQEGFDVGLHAGYASATDLEAFRHEKGLVEAYIGDDVVSCRQHYLHWDVGATPRIQSEAGIRVDSTVGFNRNIGFRAGTALPHRLFDLAADEPLNVLEVPLIIQESPLLATNALELDVPLARETMERLIDRIAETGGVATLLFHPHSLAHPDFLSLFSGAIDYARDRGAWVGSLKSDSHLVGGAGCAAPARGGGSRMTVRGATVSTLGHKVKQTLWRAEAHLSRPSSGGSTSERTSRLRRSRGLSRQLLPLARCRGCPSRQARGAGARRSGEGRERRHEHVLRGQAPASLRAP